MKKMFLLLLFVILPSVALAVDCFQCHDSAVFKATVVHAPVAGKDCLSCHGPHVSRHKGLLLKKERALCVGCHAQIADILSNSKVLHIPVRDGLCSSCHSPHASEQSKLLKKAGGELCFECHGETRKSYPVSHQPYSKGQCSACHDAHGGADHRMLRVDGSALCFSCHKQDQALRAKHLSMPLDDVDCLSCHHPHGGAKRTLLRAVEHQPFAENNCASCHAGDLGMGTCLECHEDVLATFNFAHNHLGVAGTGNPCVSCHDPHAGDRAGLLPENVGTVCRQCHADTFTRREKNLHGHTGWNRCVDCHNLHGDNSVAMLKGGNEVCNLCHDQHKEFTHPIGEKAIDDRGGQPMDCLTCHNANDGSMYRYFLRGSAERGLCVQCHQGY
jgi:predicted CXXCH cytochrome family protein